MSFYDVKKVQVISVLKVLPTIFAVLGSLIGLIMFFFFPTDLVAKFGFGARLLSWAIFVVFYTTIMVVGALVVIWLYNFTTSKLNSSIVVSLEPKSK
ncbi:MAG: hypothetical protein LBL02_01695 [Endomicrobium sp.]|jgi:hypothetical protein|nr:hypothetical protein [Endomicrobium sp.]